MKPTALGLVGQALPLWIWRLRTEKILGFLPSRFQIRHYRFVGAQADYVEAVLEHIKTLAALERVTAGGIYPKFPTR